MFPRDGLRCAVSAGGLCPCVLLNPVYQEACDAAPPITADAAAFGLLARVVSACFFSVNLLFFTLYFFHLVFNKYLLRRLLETMYISCFLLYFQPRIEAPVDHSLLEIITTVVVTNWLRFLIYSSQPCDG